MIISFYVVFAVLICFYYIMFMVRNVLEDDFYIFLSAHLISFSFLFLFLSLFNT